MRSDSPTLRQGVRRFDPRQRRRALHGDHGGPQEPHDLSLSIAIGSSVQVALFVAPLLVLASYAIAPSPMDLAFSGGLVLTGDAVGPHRRTDRRRRALRLAEGRAALAVYVILGLAFFFAPAAAAGRRSARTTAPGAIPTRASRSRRTGGHSSLVDCVGCHAERRPNRIGRGHRAKPLVRGLPHGADRPPAARGRAHRRARDARTVSAATTCTRETANLSLVNTNVVPPPRVPDRLHGARRRRARRLVDPLEPGKGLCEVCHTKTGRLPARRQGRAALPQDCTLCHSHADHFLPVADASNRNVCHADEAARFDDDPSAHSARFQCVDCHAGAVADAGPRAIAPWKRALDCHSDRMTHAPNGPPGLPCTQCHDPHGTKNSYRARPPHDDLGNEVPIRFRQPGRQGQTAASVSLSNPGTGICEVCHTTTRHYRADGTGDPHFTFSCLPCHLHARRVQPAMRSVLLALLALPRVHRQPPHVEEKAATPPATPPPGATYAGADVRRVPRRPGDVVQRTIHAQVLNESRPESDRGCEACHGPAASTPKRAAARASAALRAFVRDEPASGRKSATCPRRHAGDVNRHDFLRGEHALSNVGCTDAATPATAASATRCCGSAHPSSASAATPTCAPRSACRGAARPQRRAARLRLVSRAARHAERRKPPRAERLAAARSATTTSPGRSCSEHAGLSERGLAPAATSRTAA